MKTLKTLAKATFSGMACGIVLGIFGGLILGAVIWPGASLGPPAGMAYGLAIGFFTGLIYGFVSGLLQVRAARIPSQGAAK